MMLAASEAGDGPVVCLLHGLFGAGRNLGAVRRGLLARYRTITLDLRNHGASPHAAPMDYPTMAADVAETLSRREALPAMLLGHSMGGKVAMELALTRPEAVRALVAVDVAPIGYPPTHRRLAEAMRTLPLAPGLTRAEADQALSERVPDAAVRGFLLQNLVTGEDPLWRLGIAEISAALPVIEGFPDPGEARYEGPALFVAASRSDYVKSAYHPVIRKLFPKAEFAEIPDAGHWVHTDNLRGLMDAVVPFLAAAAPS